ncbi:MAG TPA: GGDEF domain-containing protein [Gemmatimonadales bacterium]
MTSIAAAYRGPASWPISRVVDAVRMPGGRQVLAAWAALAAAAVALAIVETYSWNGLLLPVGKAGIPLTIYPPLAVTLLIVFWLGPEWGVIPAYTAMLVSALSAGMPTGAALLFAWSTPVELLIMWGSVLVLDMNPEMPSWRDLAKYVLAALIAACASSLGGLIWMEYNGLDLVASQRGWRAWVAGDVLQILAVAPLLRWVVPPARAWTDRRLNSAPRQLLRQSTSVVLVTGIVLMMAALVFQGAWMSWHSLDISPAARTADGVLLLPRLREIALFLALLVGLTVVTTTGFAAALARIGEREGGAARRDALTGCYNRRAFESRFEMAVERSRRKERGLGLVALDVDHFKRVNDTWGHEAGDVLLRQLAVRIQGMTREHDALFRWGGEEFVLLLPATMPEEALAVAERLRASVAAHPLVRGDGSPIQVTISLGVAATTAFPADPDALLATADAACYLAKRRGRNCVGDGSVLSAATLEHPVAP